MSGPPIGVQAAEAVAVAVARRTSLLAQLPETDCVRLFHGIAEGVPGLTVDRYGPVLLVQTWRGPLAPGALEAIAEVIPDVPYPVWNHRDGGGAALRGLPEDPIGTELGLRFDVRPRHRGSDPLLFLDFRVARRWVRGHASGKSVLNLFAYTGGIGVAAAAGDAVHVVNVDFAKSALQVAATNARLNGVETVQHPEDVLPVLRHQAGLSTGGRRGQHLRFRKLERRAWDLVVLDPPRWARSRWGAVDVVRDYPTLFKPAVLATAPGGTVLATNHVPTVPEQQWVDTLQRCAAKAGRPLTQIDILKPEADFPSFDDQPPLKIAVCSV